MKRSLKKTASFGGGGIVESDVFLVFLRRRDQDAVDWRSTLRQTNRLKSISVREVLSRSREWLKSGSGDWGYDTTIP